MNSHDEYYSVRASLRNLMLLKMAFDRGIDISKYPSYQIDLDFGHDEGWDIFYRTVNEIATVTEWFFPHNGDEENGEKRYWIKQYCQDSYMSNNEHLDSVGVLVIMDELIDQRKVSPGSTGGSDFYPGFAEVTSFQNGIIVWWDEDDGGVDWVDVLYLILENIPAKEEPAHEMAI